MESEYKIHHSDGCLRGCGLVRTHMDCIVLVVYGILVCFSSHDDKRISAAENAVGRSLVILPGVVEGG